MSTSGIPEQVEEVLFTHRRGFLKTAGLLARRLRCRPEQAVPPTQPGPYPDRGSAETRLVDRDS